jgi:REP element-mobilizing transposase RayT
MKNKIYFKTPLVWEAKNQRELILGSLEGNKINDLLGSLILGRTNQRGFLLLFREFPEIKKQLWGGAFWSPSYFLASTGQVTLDVLKRYVENQNAKDL